MTHSVRNTSNPMYNNFRTTVGYYVVIFAIIFISVVLIYLPAVFRRYNILGFGNDCNERDRTGDDEDFKFSALNVIIMLLLAGVLAILGLYHAGREGAALGMKML